MQIQINPKEFINYFINPINEITKSGKVSIFTEDDILYSLSSTESNTITLYNTYRPLTIVDPLDRFSINVSKLTKGIQCTKSDSTFIELSIGEDTNSPCCSFNTKDIKFNIRLLDNNLVSVPKFSVNNFKKYVTHHTINITADKVSNIKKALDLSSDNCKFYLEQENELLYFYFGDKVSTSNHTDDISVLVAEDVKTPIPKKIYDADILRLVLKGKNDFSMKLNDNGVMYIEIKNPNANLKYITTPLLK
jgi:hypothetical protein